MLMKGMKYWFKRKSKYRYNFNYLVEGGITYLCVSDSEGGLRVPYALLFDIANRFRATYKDKSELTLYLHPQLL